MSTRQNLKQINRRKWIGGACLGLAGSAIGIPAQADFGREDSVHRPANSSAANARPMKITKVESVRFNENINVGGGSGGTGRPEFCWIRLHTDTGIVGVGETYPGINGELGALKDLSRRFLLGKDARNIDGIWQNIYQYISMRNAGGSDMRVLSAINMAQLDVLGKSMGLPLYRLLGGRSRTRVKVYNTTTDHWAIDNMKMGQDTEKIVKFLLESCRAV